MARARSVSRNRRRRSRLAAAALTLTSMMDMFTIILLFLLKSYSAEGEIYTMHPSLTLPVSISTEKPRLKLLIQLTSKHILIEGEPVVTVAEALRDFKPKTDDPEHLLIRPLLAALDRNTEKVEFIARTNPDVKFTGEVMIQGDRSIPFALLEKVMYTCGQAGYYDISLAVLTRE
ncbi:MAG TPA: hypothetical protein ENJ37_05915 [Deltaproteobacteria bacterium]|nr:hypothetical protein [Deltaproteobacteria bacterium]